MMRDIKPGSPWEPERCGDSQPQAARRASATRQNAYIESFHDKLRDECLNREVFGSLAEARVVIEQWRREYNEYRPHSSLGYGTPAEAAARCQNRHGLISLRSMRPSLRLTVLQNTPTSSVQGGWTYIYDLSRPRGGQASRGWMLRPVGGSTTPTRDWEPELTSITSRAGLV